MPKRDEAIAMLERNGFVEAAEHLRRWRNVDGNTGGWDANLKRSFPASISLLWPTGARVAALSPSAVTLLASNVESLRRVAGAKTTFDAYWMVDWSSANEPVTGTNSIWSALMRWDGEVPRLEVINFPTRDAFVQAALRTLEGDLRSLRVLLGFDFPFGYPRGFAAALGAPAGLPRWRAIWKRLEHEISDSPKNANNRFGAAAALNKELTDAFGPFYGRPTKVDPVVAQTLSSAQRGAFSFPVQTLRGPSLGATREVDRRAGTASSPWFLYGGSNSVGGQALVGIPRLAWLRERCAEARVWPLETGAKLPTRAEARVVIVEIYPSLHHVRIESSDVHDRLQVVAAVAYFARRDLDRTIENLFAAPGADADVLEEEGWILGVP